MRSMMLHGNGLQRRELKSVNRRPVLRVGIVHNDQVVRIDLVHRYEIPYCFLKCTKGLVVVQIPDMLTDESLAINDQGHRVLEVGTHRQDGAFRGQRCDRARGITSRKTENDRAKRTNASNG